MIRHYHDVECPNCKFVLKDHSFLCDPQQSYTVQFISCPSCKEVFAVSLAFLSKITAVWEMSLVRDLTEEFEKCRIENGFGEEEKNE